MKTSVEIIRMDYKIIISIEAERDTNEAYCYYESRRPGLGDRFLNELSDFYKKLKEHPKYYSFTSQNKATRSVALKTFRTELSTRLKMMNCMFIQFIILVKIQMN
jgi:hypothetical protein